MTFALTPAQFATLKTTLDATSGVQLRGANPLSGTIADSEVTLAYAYNGSDSLQVQVLEKHGMAKLASDAKIQAKLQQLIDEALA